jgi:N-formylglutamate deformylase
VKLPVVVSIPHGGTETPAELGDRVLASDADVFEDGDAFTPEIYAIGDQIAHLQAARVARAFVDLNRAEDDRPPANGDGVVKTATCFGRPIYREPLDARLTETLLAAYHRPYHAALEAAAARPGLELGLDCHSMAATPPPVAPDRDQPRPLFCLSNALGTTCDDALLERVAASFASAFEVPPGEVALNRPFSGGYITRRHGRRPLPWIQVEMNRALYLAEPWFDPAARRVDGARLSELRARFLQAVRSLWV